MRLPRFSLGRHPGERELAALAETGEPTGPGIVRHLARCHGCLDLYREFVAIRSAALAGRADPPAEWIRLGLSIPAAPPPATAMPVLRRSRRPLVFTGLAAAAVVALLATGTLRRPEPDPFHAEAAREMREDSPGGLVYSADLMPAHRGLRGAGSGEAHDRNAEALRKFHGGKASAGDAFWLVGALLASGDLGNADTYLRESLGLFPDDVRFRNLAAILAWKRNDLAGASEHLETALGMERSASVLMNLAVIRRQQGQGASAEALARELLSRYPDSEIAALAHDFLEANP